MSSDLSITYRTTGEWGAGIGMNLSAGQVDQNFYNVAVAVGALQDAQIQPNNITAITTSNNAITFTFADGSTIGPLPLPILMFKYRGAWAPSTIYAQLDTFTVEDGSDNAGLYVVLLAHTSAASFDPAAVDGSGNPLYQELLPIQPANTLAEIFALEAFGEVGA